MLMRLKSPLLLLSVLVVLPNESKAFGFEWRDLSFPAQLGAYSGMHVASASDDAKTIKTDGAQSQAAAGFVETMGDRAIEFLGDDNLSNAQKAQKFRQLLQRNFDMKTIGRFAIGRYWAAATPAQQKEYMKLFEDLVVDVYSRRFEEYQGQSLQVDSARADGAKDSIVTSYIVPESGQKFRVDWRVRSKGGQQKIVDVIIEGVSMSMTQRSDFASVIQRGGGEVTALLDHMRSQ